jgi:glucose/arabinose dehydrogenase
LIALLLQLPPPFQTPWFRKATRVVPMPESHRLTVPAGFTVNLFADSLQFARFMALAPNGDVFLAEPARTDGRITVLRDRDRDGVAETRETFASGLNRPFGLAFWRNSLYVGSNDSVVRFSYTSGQTKAVGAGDKIADLPASDAALDQDTANRLKIDISQTRGYNHWTRNVIIDPAGSKLYVTVGSATNATPENAANGFPRAAIHQYNLDGSGHHVFATGLRNPVGLAYFPGTNTLWTAVNERDHLGDDLVPDYITSVRDGGFYGWPYSYLGAHVDPTVEPQRPDLVAKAIALTSCSRLTPRRSVCCSTPVRSFRPPIATARSLRCTAPSTVRGSPATASSAFRSATAARQVRPKTSSPASSRVMTTRSRRGAAPSACCRCPTGRC